MFGLTNFTTKLESNMCYINCVVQLLNAVCLIRNLLKMKGFKEAPDSVTPVNDELSRIFNYQGVTSAGCLREIFRQKVQIARSKPVVFNKRNLDLDLFKYTTGEQEDAASFLSDVLEQIITDNTGHPVVISNSGELASTIGW